MLFLQKRYYNYKPFAESIAVNVAYDAMNENNFKAKDFKKPFDFGNSVTYSSE